MKKLFKGVLIVLAINFILGFFFLGWLGTSIVAPSFKGTGITFSDLFKKNFDPVKYKKLQANINAKGASLGKNAAAAIGKGLEKLFPAPSVDYSKVQDVKYPYQSLDDVLKQNNKAAQKGIDQGLKYLQEMGQ